MLISARNTARTVIILLFALLAPTLARADPWGSPGSGIVFGWLLTLSINTLLIIIFFFLYIHARAKNELSYRFTIYYRIYCFILVCMLALNITIFGNGVMNRYMIISGFTAVPTALELLAMFYACRDMIRVNYTG